MRRYTKAGITLFIIGIIIFLIGFSISGFNFKRLSTSISTNEQKEYVSENINSINIEDKDTAITFKQSNDEKIHIQYYENKSEYYEISSNNELIIKKKYKRKNWYEYLFNLEFNTNQSVNIYLPKSFDGDIKVKTSNDSISISDISANNIEATTTNNSLLTNNVSVNKINGSTTNGQIKLINFNAKESIKINTTNSQITLDKINTLQDIIATTSNGKIKVNDISAKNMNIQTNNAAININKSDIKENMDAVTTNAEISIDNIDIGKQIVLKSTNGSINGIILGKIIDYSIDSKTTNANSTLPQSMKAGDKILKVETTNATINIKFKEN